MTGDPHVPHPHRTAAQSEAACGDDGRELTATLRARGMRVTPQRVQVLAAVRELGHVTPDRLAEALPDVDLATIYRTLELFEELGLVRHTHLGHGSASYRPAEDDHVHLVCHACGAVTDVDATLVDHLAARLNTDLGFELDRAHFTVSGRCQACSDRDASEQREQTGAAAR